MVLSTGHYIFRILASGSGFGQSKRHQNTMTRRKAIVIWGKEIPSPASILEHLGQGKGVEALHIPDRTTFVVNIAYFAILGRLVRIWYAVLSYPIFSPTHTFVSPNAPPQASKNLLKGAHLCSPPLK